MPRSRLLRGAALVLAGAVAGVFGTLLVVPPKDSEVRGTSTGFVEQEAPPEPAGTWPEYGFTAAGTRANQALPLAPPFRQQWSHDAKALLEFPPVIEKKILVAGTNSGDVFALDLPSGRLLWQVKVTGLVASSPAIRDGIAYVATTKGRLVAFDAATGRRLWRRQLGSSIESSPVLFAQGLYVGTLDGDLFKLDRRTGAITWRVKAPGPIKSAVAIWEKKVIVGDYAGHVSAYSRQNGVRLWSTTSPGKRFRGPGRFYAGPAVSYGRVYIGNINSRVVALQVDNGAIAWVFSAKEFVYSSAAIANRTVFVGSYDKQLYALDAVEGDVRWKFNARERISGSPTVIGSLVYFSTLAREGLGTTYALDINTGAERWSFPDGRYTPAVASGDMLVITGRQKLYGFTPQ